LTGYYIFNQYI